MEGTRCGQYRITRKLASGGMGEIYVGVHELMGNEVVIKVLLPEMSVSQEITQRFFIEAQTAANLDSPGTVNVFDMGYADNGRVYIAMEKLKGEDLKKRLRRVGLLSIEQSIVIVRQLARAVGAAHEQNIIHRDLKPENIFLVPDADIQGGERVKVLDFGLAKLVENKGSFATHTGAVFGTPAYMAPEQCVDAGTVDHRADLYAIGCVLYECLCGQPPFGRGGIELIAAHLRDTPRAPRMLQPAIPPQLDNLVMQLLAKDPGQRTQSCQLLVSMLDGMLTSVRSAAHQGGYAAHNQPTVAPGHHPSGAMRQYSGPGAAPTASASSASSGRQSRFHAPSEQAGSITQAAGAMSMPKRESGSRTVWLVSIALALVVIGSVALVLTMKTESDGQTGASNPADRRPASAPADAQVGTDKEEAEAIEPLLAVARDNIEKELWQSALEAATKALEIAPGHGDAGELKRTAEAEMDNQGHYERFKKLVEANDQAGLATAFDTIAGDSVYKEKARQIYDRVKNEADTKESNEPASAYDKAIRTARNAMMKNQYGKAQRACDEALKVKPRDAVAATMCGIVACNMKKTRLAKKYQSMLPSNRKMMIRQQCIKAGLTDFN